MKSNKEAFKKVRREWEIHPATKVKKSDKRYIRRREKNNLEKYLDN